MVKKKNGNGHRKKRQYGIVSTQLAVTQLDRHGFLNAIERAQQGAPWDAILHEISSRSTMNNTSRSIGEGIVLGAVKRNLGRVPLFSSRKAQLCVI